MVGQSWAQFTLDSDYRGYTHRFGNTVIHRRNGVTQTWSRFGDFQSYNDSTGTRGSTWYGPLGRHDSYSNSRQGWQGSGFTPYWNPSATTYRRSYSPPVLPALPVLPWPRVPSPYAPNP